MVNLILRCIAASAGLLAALAVAMTLTQPIQPPRIMPSDPPIIRDNAALMPSDSPIIRDRFAATLCTGLPDCNGGPPPLTNME
jgi:hypothetical protein